MVSSLIGLFKSDPKQIKPLPLVRCAYASRLVIDAVKPCNEEGSFSSLRYLAIAAACRKCKNYANLVDNKTLRSYMIALGAGVDVLDLMYPSYLSEGSQTAKSTLSKCLDLYLQYLLDTANLCFSVCESLGFTETLSDSYVLEEGL
jgi:hypothetical protein